MNSPTNSQKGEKMEEEFLRELNSIIGLAKANKNLEKLFIKEVLDAFYDEISDEIIPSLHDAGWRAPR